MSLPTETDTYFQGLLSKKLGDARQIDDELVMLILQDGDFAELCAEYGSSPGNQNGAAGRVAAKAEALHLLPDSPHDWAIWSAVLDDPRFDPIWKRVLDDLRDPLPIVRNSLVGRLLALLSKLKKPAETASVLPLLVGTAAAASFVWVAPAAWQYAQGGGTASTSSSWSLVSVDLKETDKQLKELNTNVSNLSTAITGCSICKRHSSPAKSTPPVVTNLLGNKPVQAAALPAGGPLPIDFGPLIGELEKQGKSMGSAISKLGKRSDENNEALGKIHTDLSESSSSLIKDMDRIEQHASGTLDTLTKVGPLLAKAGTDTADSLKSISQAVTGAQGSLADLQQKRRDALALQEVLKAPLFTVDSLGQGAFFLLELRNTTRCIAFEVLRMNSASVILRYLPLENCGTVPSAKGVFSADKFLTISLNTTPRFVSATSGTGTNALYLSLEQERGLTVVPPSGKRTKIGIYSGNPDWTIKNQP